jgi:hypothetical protein
MIGVPLSETDEKTFLRRPVPYECDIIPRFPDAGTLLAHEIELRGL